MAQYYFSYLTGLFSWDWLQEMKLILQMNIYLSTKGQGDYNNSPPDIKTIDNGPIPDEIGYVLEMYLEID